MTRISSLLADLKYRRYINGTWKKLNLRPQTLYLEDNENRTVAEPFHGILHELVEKGIALSTIDKFLRPTEIKSLFDEVEIHWQRHKKNTERHNVGKDFLWEILRDIEPLTIDNPIVQLVLNEDLIRLVNNYMKTYSRIEYFDLWYNIPVSSERMRSQLWHRDPDDIIDVKVFLYLTDVGPDNGPFEYINQSGLHHKFGNILKRGIPNTPGATQEDINTWFKQKNMTTCTGPKGTMVFCDTSGFHRGGFVEKDYRYLLTSAYVTNGGYFAAARELPINPLSASKALSDMQKYSGRLMD